MWRTESGQVCRVDILPHHHTGGQGNEVSADRLGYKRAGT